MNYQNHYDRLIQKARIRSLSGYTENHHILPKCLGGTNDLQNLVKLTAEEHFVAHQLLVKIYPNNHGLIKALSMMICAFSKNTNRNNKEYGRIRRIVSKSGCGVNSPTGKLSKDNVLDIYHSEENPETISVRYNISKYIITSIKRKITYRDVTEDIQDMPGFFVDGEKTRLPIPIDFIEKIFYDTGDYAYFWEKYKATERVVRSIKGKKVFKRITLKLGTPGQVKRYGMTQSMVDEVYNATGTNSDIATRFGIHYNTVRNIKSKYSRAFNMWEEF